MNRARLEAQMKLYGDTQASLAKALNISESSLNSKINGRNGGQFTHVQLIMIRDRYKLSCKEFDLIFFDPESTRSILAEQTTHEG